MKAVLLAAGLGTRLRPFTDNKPKCLIEIGGIPLILIWLQKLLSAGITEILINTHYLSDQVVECVSRTAFMRQVTFAHEPVLLGTAGTLVKNIGFLGDDECLLIHADNYMNSNLSSFLIANEARPNYCLMSMLTFRTDNPKSCGIVEVDENMVVQKFYEKVEADHGNLANGAVYALSNNLAKSLVDEKDFSREVIPALLGKILSIETDSFFVDIGTPESLQQARAFTKSN